LAGFLALIWSNLCTRHIPDKLTPRGHHDWPDKGIILHREAFREWLRQNAAAATKPLRFLHAILNRGTPDVPSAAATSSAGRFASTAGGRA